MNKDKYTSLPDALKENGLFCVWRYEVRDGNPTKVPYNPITGRRGRSNDKDTFTDFHTAVLQMEKGHFDGIGVGIFNGLGAIDIDHCINEHGILSDNAQNVIYLMNTYAERSPSGTGIHLLFYADPSFHYDKDTYYLKNPSNGMECYISGFTNRFMTVTGDSLESCSADVRNVTENLSVFLDSYMVRPVPQSASDPSKPIGRGINLDEASVLRKIRNARNYSKFYALYHGDISGYSSHSEADLALCSMLSFYTDDTKTIDSIFRSSGLMRKKWDRKQSGSTYGQLTIQRALTQARTKYDPEGYFNRMVENYVQP